jgi:hypothetical protein
MRYPIGRLRLEFGTTKAWPWYRPIWYLNPSRLAAIENGYYAFLSLCHLCLTIGRSA